MKAFTIDGIDTFVTESRETLWAEWLRCHGSTYEDMVGDNREDALIEELDPASDLTINEDPHDGDTSPRTQTVAEWIAESRAGLLCSTEY